MMGWSPYCDDCDLINRLMDFKLSEEDCINLLEIAEENLAQYNKKLRWEIK